MKKLTLTFFSIMVMFLISACSSQSTSDSDSKNGGYKITVGHAGSEETLMHKGMEVFKKEVEENSEGQIKVEIISGGQLGGDRELQEAVQNGDITMTASSTAPISTFVPELGVFSLPFLFPDKEIAYKVLDGAFGKKMLDKMEENGFKGLGYMESFNFRNLVTNDKPVKTLEDLKNISIRTMENPYQIAIWKELGASPTTIAFPEVYSALQQGVVDAQETAIDLIISQRFYEVQKYLTETEHLLQVGMATMNLDFFNSLPSDLQEVILDSVQSAVEYQRKTAEAENPQYLKTLEENGIEIIQLPDSELKRFKDEVQPVYDMIAKEVGQDLVDELVNAVKEVQ